MRKILLALLAGLLPALASEREQQFTFALPELEGRISLGVYDMSGRLVRTLCVGAGETDFLVGLNGLIATWDGEDDAGKPLAAGKYHIRGYVVGDALKAEGVAYHFNDWIDDEKSPRVTQIEDFRRLPEGFVVLAKVSDDGRPLVFRFDQKKGFVWTSFLDPLRPPADGGSSTEEAGAPTGSPSALLAATNDYAAVLLNGGIHVLETEYGTTAKTQAEVAAQAACIEANGATLFIGESDRIRGFALPALDPASEEKTPVAFDALAIEEGHKLGASTGGSQLWESVNAQWRELPIIAAVSSISFGLAGTFWITGINSEDGKPFTGQFDRQGEFLRAYRDQFSPVKVRASRQLEEIAVLEESGSAQRLRVLSLHEAKPGSPGDWAIIFEKTIQDCRRFGIVEGQLVADAGTDSPPDQVNILLATGGLTSTPNSLPVRVTFDQTGLWLETAAGLRLAFLASQPNVRRVALLLGPDKKRLTVYAGDDAVVAEYGVQGLGNVVEIDAGEVELP